MHREIDPPRIHATIFEVGRAASVTTQAPRYHRSGHRLPCLCGAHVRILVIFLGKQMSWCQGGAIYNYQMQGARGTSAPFHHEVCQTKAMHPQLQA